MNERYIPSDDKRMKPTFSWYISIFIIIIDPMTVTKSYHKSV